MMVFNDYPCRIQFLNRQNQQMLTFAPQIGPLVAPLCQLLEKIFESLKLNFAAHLVGLNWPAVVHNVNL